MIDKPKPTSKLDETLHDIETIPGYFSKVPKIGLVLSALEKTKITTFLRENQDFLES